MTVIANTLIVLTIVVGLLFTVVTVIGVLRLPDVYTRAHAASKSATLGVLSILVGTFFHFWLNEGYFSVRILLGILFLFITAPIGGHLMSRAAYFSGVKPTELTVGDDLAEVVERAKKEKQIN
ncbi:monovalent cation/H(+) antiporter subunit G [Sporosarcina pasteurii]|uniref:Multiple resistance and pH homeostasis protein G n=1 Tax=Sporosarcina pasteurii TaxID=1474 RepID=A0A380C8D5_SPOPA|nr:monovalent cation/H(+) antiporter subunit G [Sporosarcina pasteurii]MDS9472787.1 monovalent cation/H(+) antiporter subunit G [Sporosarcina pasteurii]QBQ04438.1 Na+/H+ antiporter subunit G [Sporosarcina pasteurii]SUJ15067.1 Multiple resistance and pH homeostasis protein G [Sporosarcina pasteurii]